MKYNRKHKVTLFLSYEARAFRERGGDERFVVVSVDTGKILDDAQGYGYKSATKAWAAWKWKERGCPKPYVNPEIKRWFS